MKGIELKILRIKKNIKAGDIAYVLNVSNAYISMMEADKVPITSDILAKWIKYLDSLPDKMKSA